MKHTKGEWGIYGQSVDFPYEATIRNDAGLLIAKAEGETFSEASANAKLISAAPELLEVAIKVNELAKKIDAGEISNLEDISSLIGDITKAAIQKATT